MDSIWTGRAKGRQALLCAWCVLAVALGMLVVFACPQHALADTTSDGYEYTVNSDGVTATLTGYSGSATDLDVPSTFDGYTVTAIGNSAFASNRKLVSITLPSTIATCSSSEFYCCTSLVYADLSATALTQISDLMFYNCTSLQTVKLPKNVTSIWDYSFEFCYSLTSVDLAGKPISTISAYAFDYCTSLSSVVIPSSVTKLDYYSFGNCTSLTSITLNSKNVTGDSTAFYQVGSGSSTGVTVKLGSAITTVPTWLLSSSVISNLAAVYVYNADALFLNNVLKDFSGFKIYGYAGSTTYVYARHLDATFVSLGGSISSATVTLSSTSFTYNGKKRKPSVTVKIGVQTLEKGSAYKVTYAGGRKAIGKYKVTIKGKGVYTGSKTIYFKIVPKKAKLKSSTTSKAKKKLTVKWGKVAGSVKYQVCYRAKGTSKWKKVKVSATSKTLKSLKSGKKYQVKVRAYKKVKGKTYYGSFSKVKTVKVK